MVASARDSVAVLVQGAGLPRVPERVLLEMNIVHMHRIALHIGNAPAAGAVYLHGGHFQPLYFVKEQAETELRIFHLIADGAGLRPAVTVPFTTGDGDVPVAID